MSGLKYGSKLRFSEEAGPSFEDQSQRSESLSDAALAKALRKSQDRNQTLALEKEELQRKLVSLESEQSRLLYTVERASEENRDYAEERLRLIDELSKSRLEAKDLREKGVIARQESTENKRIGEEMRVRLEGVIVQQKTQISKLEKLASDASAEAAASSKGVGVLEEGVSYLIHERVNLLGLLSDSLRTLQNLFYDPTPFLKGGIEIERPRTALQPRRATSIKQPPLALSLPSVYQRREISDLREISIELEKEIREAAVSYSAILGGVGDCLDKAQRLSHIKQIFDACEALIADNKQANINWDDERKKFHATLSTMELKFQQLLKIKNILKTRQITQNADTRQRPLWNR